MAGKQVVVFDAMNSGFKVGQTFASMRDVARVFPQAPGTTVGLMIDGEQKQFRRAQKRIWIESYKGSLSPDVASLRNGTPTPRPGRTGRTQWEVIAPGTSQLKAGDIYQSQRELVRRMGNHTECKAKDKHTGVIYDFSRTTTMYRFKPAK